MRCLTPDKICLKAQLDGNKNNFSKLSFQTSLARCPATHTCPETGTGTYPNNLMISSKDMNAKRLTLCYMRDRFHKKEINFEEKIS